MTSHSTWPPLARWLTDTARSKPEALLLIAGGSALLLRGGFTTWRTPEAEPPPRPHADEQSASDTHQDEGRTVGLVQGAADKASDVAQDYAEKAAAYAATARENLAEGSERVVRQARALGSQAPDVLREQPILLAACGLAAGAALAALFRPSRIERQMAADAREVLQRTAKDAQARVKKAAGEAVEEVKERAADSGLDAKGLAELAREVVGAGETPQRKRTASTSPGETGAGTPKSSSPTDLAP